MRLLAIIETIHNTLHAAVQPKFFGKPIKDWLWPLFVLLFTGLVIMIFIAIGRAALSRGGDDGGDKCEGVLCGSTKIQSTSTAMDRSTVVGRSKMAGVAETGVARVAE